MYVRSSMHYRNNQIRTYTLYRQTHKHKLTITQTQTHMDTQTARLTHTRTCVQAKTHTQNART